jgi:hypothetical protein
MIWELRKWSADETAFQLDKPPSQADSVRIVRLIVDHFPKLKQLVVLESGLLTVGTPAELDEIARLLLKNGISGRIVKSQKTRIRS